MRAADATSRAVVVGATGAPERAARATCKTALVAESLVALEASRVRAAGALAGTAIAAKLYPLASAGARYARPGAEAAGTRGRARRLTTSRGRPAG